MDTAEEPTWDWQCCSLKPPLDERPQLSETQADRLTALFKMFSNSNRLRLLHALVRAGEMRSTDVAKAAGLKPQAASNQLQRLVDRGILAARRSGSNVLYRIVDPCVPVLLERGLCLIECGAEPMERNPSAVTADNSDFSRTTPVGV
jgi:DNA-binding transcriptional ArsR family regulator